MHTVVTPMHTVVTPMQPEATRTRMVAIPMQVTAKASSTTMSAVVSPSVPSAPQPSTRVLLVDDHPTVLWGLERLIDSAKPAMEVVGTATNRADALAAAAQHQPDVVLVDIELGGDCGVDLLQELLRQCDAKPIMFSGLRESELHERAVLQGARGVVHKTDATDVILKAIGLVHRGELWLDRAATARVIETLRTGGAQKQIEASHSGIAALTQKERAIVVAVIEHKGAPSKVIAATLHISLHTLRNHFATIYSKLDVRNRMDLLMYAHEHGLHQLLVASLSSAVLHGPTQVRKPHEITQIRHLETTKDTRNDRCGSGQRPVETRNRAERYGTSSSRAGRNANL